MFSFEYTNVQKQTIAVGCISNFFHAHRIHLLVSRNVTFLKIKFKETNEFGFFFLDSNLNSLIKIMQKLSKKNLGLYDK